MIGIKAEIVDESVTGWHLRTLDGKQSTWLGVHTTGRCLSSATYRDKRIGSFLVPYEWARDAGFTRGHK